MDRTKTVEIYADSKGRPTPCSGPTCSKRITWTTVVGSGKKMCFDDVLVLQTRHEPETQRLIEVVDLERNHWATCPDRDRFRRK